MSRSSHEHQNKPFAGLNDLLKKKEIQLASCPPVPPVSEIKPHVNPQQDTLLFQQAMEGVTPLSKEDRRSRTARRTKVSHNPPDPDQEVFRKLEQLILVGDGFRVADTPEYIEGVGHNIPHEVARRLHRGDFAIQDYIDLHGLTAVEAEIVFNGFVKEAIQTRKRAILIVHGRGLSSPGNPVLKKAMIRWLTIGPWRKWVMAFTSARKFDGGAGATYILLRERPITHREKQKKEKPG